MPGHLRPPLIAPSGNPVQGGERRYVQTLPLFRNNGGAGFYTVNTAEFEVWTPSTRLITALTIGFLPDISEDTYSADPGGAAPLPPGWVATLDVWARTDKTSVGGGRRIRGNSIIPGPGPTLRPTQLPWSWEAVTGVDQWRGKATVPMNPETFSGTNVIDDGYLLATVNWEPAPGDDISDDELRRLFTACKLVAGANAGAIVYQAFLD
jgi:hypothetical protein